MTVRRLVRQLNAERRKYAFMNQHQNVGEIVADKGKNHLKVVKYLGMVILIRCFSGLLE